LSRGRSSSTRRFSAALLGGGLCAGEGALARGCEAVRTLHPLLGDEGRAAALETCVAASDDGAAATAPVKAQLSALGEIKVEGKPAVGVRVASKGHKDVNLYFDKQNGLLVKIEHRTVDFQSGQEVNEERVLTEYKDVDGRKLPGRVEVRYGDKVYAVLDVNSWKLEAAK